MLEYPKLVWEILDAEKNLQKGKQYLFHLKLHELKNFNPYIFLDFTKLV